MLEDNSSEEEQKRGRKNSRKMSAKAPKKSKKNQKKNHAKVKKVLNRRQKKFEKNKWRDFNAVFKSEYPNFEIEDMTTTKSELIILLRERDR